MVYQDYQQLFHSQPLFTIAFVLFWQTEIGKKGAHNMCMKLTLDPYKHFGRMFTRQKQYVYQIHSAPAVVFVVHGSVTSAFKAK